MGLALASAALSVLLYIEPCGRPRHEISNQTIMRAYNAMALDRRESSLSGRLTNGTGLACRGLTAPARRRQEDELRDAKYDHNCEFDELREHFCARERAAAARKIHRGPAPTVDARRSRSTRRLLS